jgi:hypothetical protein
MDLRLSSGDNTDIYVANVTGLDLKYRIMDKGYAADITDYVNSFYPEIRMMLERDPGLSEEITYEGRIMAIPGCQSPVYNLFTLVIQNDFYEIEDKNRYLTLDEVADIYLELNNHIDSGYYGIINFDFISRLILYDNGLPLMLRSYNILLDNDKLTFFEDNDLFIDAFEYAEKIYATLGTLEYRTFRWDEGWTDPVKYKNSSYGATKQVKPPVAPVIELVSYSSFRKQIYSNTANFTQSYTVMPIKTNAPYGVLRYEPKYFISSTCENIDAALIFLHVLEWDQDNYILFRYGIENRNYSNTPNGIEHNNMYNFEVLRFENPYIEPKLTHDFGLWNSFLSEYVSAQGMNKSAYEYESNFQALIMAINELRNSDSEAIDFLDERYRLISGIDSYIRNKTGSYNEYLKLYNLSDTDALREKIKIAMMSPKKEHE